MPNFIEIEETACGRTDLWTYVRTDGWTFQTVFIRKTLSTSLPKKQTVPSPHVYGSPLGV